MTDTYKYKAFISYSHRDEKWATWLHRALEHYRLPRKLKGTSTSHGEVPPRVRPVFRDRDELSSGTNLADTVKQALANAENLKQANAEIRQQVERREPDRGVFTFSRVLALGQRGDPPLRKPRQAGPHLLHDRGRRPGR